MSAKEEGNVHKWKDWQNLKTQVDKKPHPKPPENSLPLSHTNGPPRILPKLGTIIHVRCTWLSFTGCNK